MLLIVGAIFAGLVVAYEVVSRIPPMAGTPLGVGGGGAMHVANGSGGIYRPSVPGETNRSDAVGTVLNLHPDGNPGGVVQAAWVKGSDGKWYFSSAPALYDPTGPDTVGDPATGGFPGAKLGWAGQTVTAPAPAAAVQPNPPLVAQPFVSSFTNQSPGT